MMEYIRSLKWIDYFFFCIFEPRRLVNLIDRKEGKPLLIGSLIVIAASFFQIVAYSLLGNETGFFFVKISYGWVFCLFAAFMQIMIMSSLWDFISQMRSHKGSIKLVLNLAGFSYFPFLFLLPLMTITTTAHLVPVFFYIFFLVALHVWQAFILIQGISEIYQISFNESLLIFIMPFIIFGLLSFFMTILLFIISFGFLTNL